MKKINKKATLTILTVGFIIFATSCGSTSGKHACPERISISIMK